MQNTKFCPGQRPEQIDAGAGEAASAVQFEDASADVDDVPQVGGENCE